jgi:hypothetical protein
MHLDQNPFFRKPITSWYDSNFACWILVGAMILILAFALVGVGVASSNPAFQKHIWFPGLLGFLSIFLVLKVFFRIHNRSKNN